MLSVLTPYISNDILVYRRSVQFASLY